MASSAVPVHQRDHVPHIADAASSGLSQISSEKSEADLSIDPPEYCWYFQRFQKPGIRFL